MSKIEDNDSIAGKNISQADKSKISNPEQDNSKQSFKKQLGDILQTHSIEIEALTQKTSQIEAQLNALPSSFEAIITDKLNNFLNIIQQQQGQQPQTPLDPNASMQNAASMFQALSPQDKAQAFGSLLDGISKIIGAWKGGAQPQQDSMGELGKQLVTDLIRATVDDIRQKVYQVRLKPPPDMVQSSAQTTHSLQ